MTVLKLLFLLSLYGVSYAATAETDKLQGAWLMKSDIPTYYKFNGDGRFLVNFVNPQSKRIMAVTAGSYDVDGDKLTLKQEGQEKTLEQLFTIKGDQMDWEVISEYESYGGNVSLKRVTKVELHTPEAFYAKDKKDYYNTFLE